MRLVPLLLTLLPVCLPPLLAAQDAPPPVPPRPPEVTDSAVARGHDLFHGSANCAACHGLEGVGTDSGAPLAQGIWMHGSDSYQGIVSRIVHGIPKKVSTRDTAMPMRGWITLTDAEVRDVAAYVWVISHQWTTPAKPRSP
ncbi:MAG: cytochrome c [Gemmatimonadota bacterium]|nr:cytochrome c [Gemmatimonadota bacterium]